MIAVAIVNYNTVDHLRACLASLAAAGAGEVIVKDNGSRDGSVAMVAGEFPEVRLHPDRSNPGYGGGANIAIGACRAPFVLLLNSDTLLRPGTLEALAGYLDAHPRVAVVGPRLHNADGSLQRSAHAFPRPATLRPLVRLIPGLRDRSLLTWPHDRARKVAWVKGAALAIRRSAFEAVGGFDPSFFMYFEETDLCARLARIGWETHFTPACVVEHLGGASTEQVRGPMAVAFYASMRRFYRRHYPPADLAVLDRTLRVQLRLASLRDRLRAGIVSDPARRARLGEDAGIWRAVLRSLDTEPPHDDRLPSGPGAPGC